MGNGPDSRSVIWTVTSTSSPLQLSSLLVSRSRSASSSSASLTSSQSKMPDTPAPLTPRIVPGAPPPAPVTKSQKKKRKGPKTKEGSDAGSHVVVPDTTSAALIEKAPEEAEIKEGVVAPQLVAQPSEDAQTPTTDVKPSPVVEMLNKRLRTNGKKIVSAFTTPGLAGTCTRPSILSCPGIRHRPVALCVCSTLAP